MSVAKIIEISSESPKSFEDAVSERDYPGSQKPYTASNRLG